jgi:hypothetical protein
MLVLGVEDRSNTDTQTNTQTVQRLEHSLRGSHGPQLVEHGSVKSGFGPSSTIWFAYWKQPADFEAWRLKSDIEKIFDDLQYLDGDIGIWREICYLSLDHNETSYSRSDNVTGLGNLSDAMEITPVHGYWGSARDRIVAAAEDDLDASVSTSPVELSTGYGARIRVVAPANTCLIKTTQDIHAANTQQTEVYLRDVEPAFHAGLHYLRDNRVDTGCIGMRFIEEDGPSQTQSLRTLGLGYFDSLSSLEKWTHSHPTHNEIMRCFQEMVGRFEGEPGLNLWHEITIFEAGRLIGDYVNCTPDGSLLNSAGQHEQLHHD